MSNKDFRRLKVEECLEDDGWMPSLLGCLCGETGMNRLGILSGLLTTDMGKTKNSPNSGTGCCRC
jgi:hypothetical protein